MIKSLRTLALVATLSLAAAPALRADRMGCNPHPQAVQTPGLSTFQVVQAVAMTYLGA